MRTEPLDVIASPQAAITALDPVRSRLLAALGEPRSATDLARLVDLPRQRVNYHVRQLEAQGLVSLAGQRQWGGITERRYVATAAAYLLSPETLGPAAAQVSNDERSDRLSASFLAAAAGRVLREVGALIRRSRTSGRTVETFALDAEVTFASPADRAAFARDLTDAVTAVISRHHDARSGSGRTHRLLVAAHPIPDPDTFAIESEEDTDD